MYAQLGDIVFDGLQDLDSLSQSTSAVYAEMPRLQGKPTIQRTGTGLSTVRLSIRLFDELYDVEAEIARLEAYMADGEVLPLITGRGIILGDFVIESIDSRTEKMRINGQILEATLTLNLREYNTADYAARRTQIARDNAFALESANAQTVQDNPRTTQAIEYQSGDDVSVLSTSTNAAINTDLPAAQSSTDVETHHRNRMAERLARVIATVTQARSRINATTGDLFTNTRDLDTALSAMSVSASALRTAALTGTVTIADVATLAADLEIKRSDMLRDAGHLIGYIGTRK